MKYTYIHMFNSVYGMTEEQALEFAKERCARELAKELLKDAKYELEPDGSVRITIDI